MSRKIIFLNKRTILCIGLLLTFFATVSTSFAVAPVCAGICDVYVDPAGDDSNSGAPGDPLKTIQAAINQVDVGGTVHVAAGTYPESLDIPKALTLMGAGEGSTIIDASGSVDYSIDVTDSYVTLEGFILEGNPAGTYGIKVAGPSPTRISDVVVQNVTVQNSKRTGVDFNGVDNVTIDNVTIKDTPSGNGFALTDSNNVNTSNLTTMNNAWGGFAIYTFGRYFSLGSDNVNISGTNSFGEANKIYVQRGNFNDPGNPEPVTNLTVNGFAYTVMNDTFRPGGENFTFYQITQSDAIDFAIGLATPADSYVNEIATGDFYVGQNLSGTMTIEAAIDHASDGDKIYVLAGTYVEDGQIVVDVSVMLIGAGKTDTVIKTNQDTGTSGDSRAWFLVDANKSFDVRDLTFDGDGYKIYQAIRNKGEGSVDNVLFTNIKYNESGPHYQGVAIAAFGTGTVDVTNSMFTEIGRIGVLYFGNGVDGSNFEGNMYTGKGVGDWLDYALDISAGAEVTVKDNDISENKGVASSDGSISAGILVSTFFAPGTGATITENDLYNNTTGIAVGFNSSDTSNVVANQNNITDNDYGISTQNAIVDGTCNWWGDASGPAGEGMGSGDPVDDDVTYVPWLLEEATSDACIGGDGDVTVTKFNDLNQNGDQDANNGENSLAEWTFEIKQNGQVLFTTQTGNDGQLNLNLAPGDYEICEIMQPNWVNSTPVCQNITVEANNGGGGNGGVGIDVDGNASDWDLNADFFANMYEAGNPTKQLLSKSYLRYECSTETLYVLVLVEDGVTADMSASDAWMKVYDLSNSTQFDGNSGDDGVPPDFTWLPNSQGYEASFSLAKADYDEVEIHLNVTWDGESGRTSSTGKKQQDYTPLDLECDEEGGDPEPVELSFGNYYEEPTGTIIIIKDTVPNDGQDFGFTTTGELTPVMFSLDDDADGTLSNMQTFNGVEAGSYTVTETSHPWYTTTLVCEDRDQGTITSGATATIDLDPGETVTCTYTNTEKPGTIVIIKDTVPDNGEDFSFTTTGGLSLANFMLDDDDNDTLSNTQIFSDVSAGSYTVQEAAHEDYTTELVCDDSDSSTFDDGYGANIALDPGETVTCTYTNTIKPGNILIIKDTVPDDGQDFSFTTTGGLTPATFDLDDDADGTLSNQRSFDSIAPGSYTVTEIAHDNYTTTLQCVDPDQGTTVLDATATIDVDPDETVICTYTNTQKAGNITIIKDVVYNADIDIDSDRDFDFFSTELGNFVLDDPLADDADGVSNTVSFNNLLPGSYTVRENPNGNWMQSVECVGDDGVTYLNPDVGATIDLDAGEGVVCTFTNERVVYDLTIEKVLGDNAAAYGSDWQFTLASLLNLVPGDIDQDFGVVATTPGAGGSTTLTLPLDAYRVGENVPAGYDLNNINCGAGGQSTTPPQSDGFTIILDQDLTCVFTNIEEPGSLTLIKTVPVSQANSAPAFDFVTDYIGNQALQPTNTGSVGTPAIEVQPGTYNIEETNIPNGWYLKDITCDANHVENNNSVAVDVATGQDVTCTFTNEQRGNITVVKDVTEGDESQVFNFKFVDGNNAPVPFPLSETGNEDGLFDGLIPGDFTITETNIPAGWSLDDVSCVSTNGMSNFSDVANGKTVTLASGDDVTCTFSNSEDDDPNVPPTIIEPQIPCMMIGDAVNVNVMATDPDDAVLRYEFQNLPPGVIHADVTSGQLTGQISPNAVPGIYEVTVIVVDGAGNRVSITFDWCIEPSDIVCTPDPIADLVGYIYFDNNTLRWTGAIRNRSETCDYNVGMASYKSTGNNLQSQTLFDHSPAGEPGYNLQPGEVVLLTVDTPECSAQLDIYFNASHLGVYDQYAQTDADMPPMALPAFYTGNYGPLGDIYGPRLIGALHINGDNYCVDDNGTSTPEPEETQVTPSPEATDVAPTPEETQPASNRDADWDGIEDSVDACPTEGDWGLGLDSTGCPYKDTDGDDFFDRDDVCPMKGDEAGLGVDGDGCPYYDADWDGVYDRNDSCPARGDEYGNGIDATGCPIPDAPADDDSASSPARDADWDGIADSADACPMKGNEGGLGIDSTGCPYYDADWDGVYDRNDACPTRGDEYGNGIDGTGCPIPNTPEPPATATPASETTPEPGSGG